MSIVNRDQDLMAREREALGLPPGGPNGRSIAERAQELPPEVELFPLGSVDGDAELDPRDLIPHGADVRLECNLSNAKVPLRNGLYRFGERGQVLVSFEAGKVQQVPEFGDEGPDGQRRVEAVMLRQALRATYVQDGRDLFTRQQVEDMLLQFTSPEQVRQALSSDH